MTRPGLLCVLSFLLLLFLAVSAPATAAGSDVSEADREWLERVAILMTPEERSAYLATEADHRRRAFRQRFWEERDPFPETGRNELLDRWDRRWEEAKARWDGPEDARFRSYLLHGPPEEIRPAPSGIGDSEGEIWSYRRSETLPEPFVLSFLTDEGGGRLESARRVEGGEPLDWPAIEDRVLASLRPASGWVSDFRSRSTDPPGSGKPLAGRLEIQYPERREGHTVVQALISLPTAGLQSVDEASPNRYRILVDGEVLRKGEIFETFRYRYETPRDPPSASSLPLILERLLPPGPYTLVLRVRDEEGDGWFRAERPLAVPLLRAGGPGTGEVVVRIRSPAEEMLTGPFRARADVQGPGVARVRFELDGEVALSKRSPPYDVGLDLGPRPRPHRLRVVAVDDAGRELASDRTMLNVGPHRFAVRLLEPLPGTGDALPLRATATVEVPRGERVDRVELFLDETRVATLYQPPFIQRLPTPPGEGPGYVRAVAYLDGGASAEDLVFLDAPAHLDAVEVEVVELFTTVVDRRGRPVPGLERKDFRVFEDDRPQEVRRFAWVDDVPLHAGILLDTSTSMAEQVDEAEKAAMGFFQKVLTPRDRAVVITFDDAPRLRVPFTNRLELLAGGLADLGVQGETALYDSLVYALHHFSGIRGKRLLILLSDGADVKSRYGFDDVLELARRTGVAIYTVGLGLPASAQRERSVLLRLGSETGGRSFFVDRASELDRIYESIEEELRAQYLLTYQSDAGDDDRYRTIRVEVEGNGLEARTREGYYP